jgi:hypothetical protein
VPARPPPPRYGAGVFRLLIAIAIVGLLAWCGATVNLGKRTFFGHVRAIWATPEAQDMKEDLKRKAGPAAEKVKRGVEAGFREAAKPAGADGGAAEAP